MIEPSLSKDQNSVLKKVVDVGIEAIVAFALERVLDWFIGYLFGN